MAGTVFINYRRGDEPGFTQALFSRLEQAFPADKLFMDVDHIPAGEDFVRVLESQVAQCDVMLAVIGKEWLSVTDERGNRRLDDPHDFVRIEIESALKQNKRVIPILVHEARMPHPDDLPESLKPLARRNAVRLTHERFKADAQGLIKALQQALDAAEAERRAQAEAAQQAKAQEERRRQEEAAREQERARREEEERLRQAKEQARLNAIAGLSAEQIAKAEELANWDFIKDSPQPQDFRDHLARFPGGVCERMARRQLATLMWHGLGESPGKSALESYLEEFPDSAQSEQAKASLATLDRASAERTKELQSAEQQAFEQAKRKDRADAIVAFLAAHPDSPLAAEARELQAALLRRDGMYERARAARDPAILRSFLEQYPLDARIDDIRRRLRRMEARPRAPLNKSILVVSALLLLFVVAGGVWLVMQSLWPPAGELTLTGPDALAFKGAQGGPFSPPSLTVELRASGGRLNWSTPDKPSWLDVVPDSGDLPDRGTVSVELKPAQRARSLPTSRSDTLKFRNSSDAKSADRVVTVTLEVAPPFSPPQPPTTGPQPKPPVDAAGYPSRPARMVVGFAPGGSADIFARVIGQGLSERLGQSFIVENRAGAAGNLAAETVAKAAPDGYSLLILSATNTINASLYENPDFNLVRDIAPAAGATVRTPLVVVVAPSFSVRTISELITYAKANRGKVNMASGGPGSLSHMAGELFKMMTGADLLHVPYRGEASAITDVIAGAAQVMFANGPAALQNVKAGKLRALAVTTTTRWTALPDVPTLGEVVRGYEASAWYGVGAPRDTPAAILDKLNRTINPLLTDANTQARLADMGGTVILLTRAEFGNFIAAETEKWAKVGKFSGTKANR